MVPSLLWSSPALSVRSHPSATSRAPRRAYPHCRQHHHHRLEGGELESCSVARHVDPVPRLHPGLDRLNWNGPEPANFVLRQTRVWNLVPTSRITSALGCSFGSQVPTTESRRCECVHILGCLPLGGTSPTLWMGLQNEAFKMKPLKFKMKALKWRL